MGYIIGIIFITVIFAHNHEMVTSNENPVEVMQATLDHFVNATYANGNININDALTYTKKVAENQKRVNNIIRLLPYIPESYQGDYANYVSAIHCNQQLPTIEADASRVATSNEIVARFTITRAQVLDIIDKAIPPTTPPEPLTSRYYLPTIGAVAIVSVIAALSYIAGY